VRGRIIKAREFAGAVVALEVLAGDAHFLIGGGAGGGRKKGRGASRGATPSISLAAGLALAADTAIVQERFVAVDVLMGWS